MATVHRPSSKLFVIVGCLVTGILLTGCNESISGQLTVHKKLSVKTESPWGDDADYLNRDEQKLSPGTYKAALNLYFKKKLMLEIKTGKWTSVRATVDFPADQSFPKEGGNFSISAADSGQPWDLVGAMEVQKTAGESVRAVEQCTYTVEEWVCSSYPGYPAYPGYPGYPYPGPGYGYPTYPGQRCYWTARSAIGSQEVEYHYVFTRKNINLAITEPGLSETVANFQASDNSEEKVYTFSGACR